MSLPRVAIVGGGFSGIVTLAHLVEKATKPIAIDLFEKQAQLAQGIAYSTQDITHLLNVRSDRMGASYGEPGSFLAWMNSGEGQAAIKKLCPDYRPAADNFAPRLLYAAYLQSLLERALTQAKAKSIAITLHQAEVIKASTQNALPVLHTATGAYAADAIVLATGNLPARSFSFAADLPGDRYIRDIWPLTKDARFTERLTSMNTDSTIVIIGSGLTTVDTVLSLKARGYKGKIVAISRNGVLPAGHAAADPYPSWQWVNEPQAAPNTALGLLVGLRREIAKAHQAGYDWRAVIDSLRPVTQTLWKRLAAKEKQLFLRRLFTLWNVHRHRMAPPVHEAISTWQKDGSFTVIAGKIVSVTPKENTLVVTYRTHKATATLPAELVINCTGPEYDLAISGHPLLKDLLQQGWIAPHPIRIGIELADNGTAAGKVSNALFPIGTLRIGEELECTAVPELRDQTQRIATSVLAHLGS